MIPGNAEGSWEYKWMFVEPEGIDRQNRRQPDAKRPGGNESWCLSRCGTAILAIPISQTCSNIHDQVAILHEIPVYRQWGIVFSQEISFRRLQRNGKVLIFCEGKET